MTSVATLHGRRSFEDVTKDFDIKRSSWYWAGYFSDVAPVTPERVAEKWPVKQCHWLKPGESGLS